VLFSIIGFGTNAEANCNNSNLASSVITVGGSGGQSNCTNPTSTSPANCVGGYPVPSWQAGLNVPLNGRSVPDVSLFSGGGFSGNAYAVCELDKQAGGTCATGFIGVGGTSAASPTFAAIMALVNQKTGSREGNAGVVLYKLATKQTATACNSSAANGHARLTRKHLVCPLVCPPRFR
jgi:subtilisin family serine protease